MTSWTQRALHGTIGKSQRLTASGNHRKALKLNRRAIDLLDRAVRLDPNPLAAILHRTTAAHLHYDQAALLHQLGDDDAAVEAGRTAVHLYTDVDPTHGDPDRVTAVLREFRQRSGESPSAFEDHVAHTANARSYLALLLASHRGAACADEVERLSTAAVRTFEELVRSGQTYGPDDLRRVVAQANQAQQLLLR